MELKDLIKEKEREMRKRQHLISKKVILKEEFTDKESKLILETDFKKMGLTTDKMRTAFIKDTLKKERRELAYINDDIEISTMQIEIINDQIKYAYEFRDEKPKCKHSLNISEGKKIPKKE